MTNPALFIALVAFIGMCIQTYRFNRVKRLERQMYEVYRFMNIVRMTISAEKLMEEIDKKYQESLKHGEQR